MNKFLLWLLSNQIQSILMYCCVLLWNIEFATICKDSLLSQYIIAGCERVTPRSFDNEANHVTSQTMDVRALYLASVNDQNTTICSLDF